MAGVADMMEVLAKGRIFEVSFDEYINTVNGLFNFLEICGGAVVYMMTGTTDTKSQGCLQGSAFSFLFNGIFMIVSSFLSATSGHYLTGIFYIQGARLLDAQAGKSSFQHLNVPSL
ncbi:uncharacterized protein LOC142766068 [Rhipicephalus microplus]|uniref:uncharacterized protein LOC142766068 n=1 Tax=Rhipicephalus microplus TaxID=6941 RepID=UPI003F6C8B7A